mmetsp:Transcript_34201/g.62557  ORF Transcript_34201/g.62557 Transcript_34201/m.62557 type:complete len:217 (-) Transcript_34201:164-814(-)
MEVRAQSFDDGSCKCRRVSNRRTKPRRRGRWRWRRRRGSSRRVSGRHCEKCDNFETKGRSGRSRPGGFAHVGTKVAPRVVGRCERGASRGVARVGRRHSACLPRPTAPQSVLPQRPLGVCWAVRSRGGVRPLVSPLPADDLGQPPLHARSVCTVPPRQLRRHPTRPRGADLELGGDPGATRAGGREGSSDGDVHAPPTRVEAVRGRHPGKASARPS